MTNLVTIRELQSTGNLSLLREVKVRKALGELEVSHNTLEHWSEKNLLVFSAMLPKLMTWGYAELSSDSEDGYIVEPDIEAIYSQPGAANMLSYMNSWTQYHGSLVEQHHQKTIAFRVLLQSTLQNSR
jgi:hypothetical protein